MPNTLKALSKSVYLESIALVGEGSVDQEFKDTEGFVVLALAAVKAALSSDDSLPEDLVSELKSVRKLLKGTRSQLSNDKEASAGDKRKRDGAACTSSSEIDLGQYANQEGKLFSGNDKKQEKFARLMGGKKAEHTGDSGLHHSTFAKSLDEVKKMNQDLEKEFTYALEHKGKKGLGA